MTRAWAISIRPTHRIVVPRIGQNVIAEPTPTKTNHAAVAT